MAKITRIATTVTARYFTGQGAADAFYLDGRLTGRRESRAADITLDREDRGFFLATFAHQAATGRDAQQDLTEQRALLDRILNDVKKTGRNIDAEINELADCAVSVSGRMTLQNSGARQPYFAGIIIKDQEIASTTIGRGCTYLYRNDVLYPLTDDDFEMEEIDAFGHPVDNLDVYCAGVAGTVRYSNIAQLQMDDCLIACNREVMEALGQREVLRILYEAEDQCDAAGMIITEAAAKSPGAPLQFMIGFVESATVTDKSTRGFGLGRSKSTASTSTHSVKLPVPPEDLSAVPPIFGGEKSEETDADEPVESIVEPEETTSESVSIWAESNDEPSYWEADEADEEGGLDIPDISDHAAPAFTMTGGNRNKPENADIFDDAGLPEDEEDDGSMYGRSRAGMYVIIAIVTIATIVALYLIFRKPPEGTTPTTTGDPAATTTLATTEPGANTSATTAETTAPGETTEPSETTEATTTAAPTIDPATPKDLPATYEVQPGNTLYMIAVYFYDSGEEQYLQLIRDANALDGDSIVAGVPLEIPDPAAATEATTTAQE